MLTHYHPWDENDIFAYCGHRMTAADTHSPQPTCAACAARQAALEQAIEDTPIALDAEEARIDLASELFDWAVDLTRSYAATLTPRVSTLAAHREGECARGCGFCAELDALSMELTKLFGARRPDANRIEEIEARLTELGNASWIADAARDAELADEAASDAACDARRDEAVMS